MTNESHVLHFERCPACAKLGNDRSGDNLAVYSDGHTYCFKCGFGSRSTKIKLRNTETNRTDNELSLPHDVTAGLPYEARLWLQQYELTRKDIIKHNILWSPYLSRIIFPIFDNTGLIAWQGRYVKTENDQNEFSKKVGKWYSQGEIHEILHPINVTESKTVLVEDIVSAIKVGSITGATPLFGSTLSLKTILRLKTIVNSVVIWLDPDMRSKSVKYSNLCRLMGLEVRTVFSDKDPKEHTYVEIDKILNQE